MGEGGGGGALVGQLLVARAIYDSSAGPSLARSLGHPLSWLLLSPEQDFLCLLLCYLQNKEIVHLKAILWTTKLLESWMGLIPLKEPEIQMSSHI